MQGILLINKPKGISSFDAIRRLRNILGIKKIGHAGTLDPLATGLLIILIGAATKQQNRFMKLDKTYEAEITLGAVSTTDDSEGVVSEVRSQKSEFRKPTKHEVEKTLKTFVGTIKQQPPEFSAVKIDGQRAYRLARKGVKVAMPTRAVKIYNLDFVSYDYPKLRIKARVSSGTYIRSLARDIGKKLGTGAYLSGLMRTQIGNHHLKDAIDIDGADRQLIETQISPTSRAQ